ncbi:hypothetical protein P3W24_15685 [Luteibacter sp. PPL201]|uniref:Uncharacterized protein n=1 Tax=Luteibacter sahnii TaxID=3021977 RepID=A0ABT6BE46_9GAMM|nr:hypothetical protein [Luteibacter sp. PPL193]MDY1548759.1 hypothetical protein [Luteibacter sp. PPL193]
MGIFSSMAKVTKARAEVVLAREETVAPAASLIARGYEHPLTVVSVAAGAGFLLGTTRMNPLAVPGVSGLVAGGSADIVSRIISTVAGGLIGDLVGGGGDGDADDAAADTP